MRTFRTLTLKEKDEIETRFDKELVVSLIQPAKTLVEVASLARMCRTH